MKLALNADLDFESIGREETVKLIKEAGFDAAFYSWREKGNAELAAELLDKYGLELQSVHAPFSHIADFWDKEKCSRELEHQVACLEDAAEFGARLVVSHVFIGFGEQHPNDTGVDTFLKYLDEAKKLGVSLAFENTEGEKYLDYLMQNITGVENAGFCWDSGHEQCYNRGRDLLGAYGDRLLCTHINDNLGVTGSEITFLDDSHLVPFDGIIDWSDAAARLKKTGFSGTLTIEMTTKNRPNRNTHYIYDGLTPAQYLARVYAAGVRIAGMINN